MRILALDSSSKAASCALLDGGVLLGESYLNCGLTHSQTLLPLTRDLCRAANVPLSSLEGVAVSAGPGSFTGLRIGLAAAKALAYALGVPCMGVSTLHALAYGLRGYTGVCCAALDARRGEVYNALFELRGGQVRRLCDDRAIPAAALAEESLLANAEGVLLCGDGAQLCLAALPGAKLVPEHERYQRASGVGFAAMEEMRWEDPAQVRPVYLRLSQAERERAEKEGRGNK